MAATFTKFPNELLDRLPEFAPAEFVILAAVCRHTNGWHRNTATLGLSELAKATGLSRRTLITHLAALCSRDEETGRPPVLERVDSPTGYIYKLAVQVCDCPTKQPVQTLHLEGEQAVQNLHSESKQPVQNLHPQSAKFAPPYIIEKEKEKEKDTTPTLSVDPLRERVVEEPSTPNPSPAGLTPEEVEAAKPFVRILRSLPGYRPVRDPGTEALPGDGRWYHEERRQFPKLDLVQQAKSCVAYVAAEAGEAGADWKHARSRLHGWFLKAERERRAEERERVSVPERPLTEEERKSLARVIAREREDFARRGLPVLNHQNRWGTEIPGFVLPKGALLQ